MALIVVLLVVVAEDVSPRPVLEKPNCVSRNFSNGTSSFSIWSGSKHVADDGFDSELRKRRMREHAQNWNPVFREEEFAANLRSRR